uniref:BZIP domain-containing protein n=1 Tax=Panagrellus redivivus TaxID=6233 RepID=A0A7E4URG2_PANRE
MSASTSHQKQPKSATSSSLPEPPKPDVKTEPSLPTTEEKPEILPGMILRDTKLPGRKLEDRDVRIVHNKTLSAEERSAIGQRTKRIFAERKAKRKQIAERLHKNKRLKAEEREVKPDEPTEPVAVETSVDGIGKRIALLERTRRFQMGSLDVLAEKEVKKRKKRRVSAKSADSGGVEMTDDVKEEAEIVPSGSGNDEDGNVLDEDVEKEGEIKAVNVEGQVKALKSNVQINDLEKQAHNNIDVTIEPGTSQEEAIKPPANQQAQFVHPEPVQIMEHAEVYEEVIYVDEPDQYDQGQPIYYINPADQDQIIEIVETYEE